MFETFSKTDKQTWKKQVIRDLKGKDFDEALLWKTTAGFALEPYYTAEGIQPNALPITEGCKNMPYVPYKSEKETNALIMRHLKNGADGVYLDLQGVNISQVRFAILLNGIKLNETPIIFSVSDSIDFFVDALQKIMPYRWRGGLVDNTVSDYLRTGSMSDVAWENIKSNLEKMPDNEKFKALILDASVYQEAGANAVQELALTLAMVATYIDKLTDLNISPQQIVAQLQISLGVGTNYFFEIAKVRALKILMNQLLTDFGVQNAILPIHAATTLYYDAAVSPYTNLLRRTTEAMAALIGGCDFLTVRTYNATFAESNDFDERIARNVLILLKEEAYLANVSDPSGGSYYIENLTNELCENAWHLFLDIENRGGLLKIAENGLLRTWVDQAFLEQKREIEAGKVLVGVNKYQFDDENINQPFKQETLTYPDWCLPRRRLAESVEL